jgi:hypothetical protein
LPFDSKTSEFLKRKKPGTRKIYSAGLDAFEKFYEPQGTIPQFLDRVQADRNLGWRETQNIATNVMGDFVMWLKPQYARKSVRSYVGAVQSLAKYFGLPFSTRDTALPASNPESKKFPWTLEETAEFVGLMKLPLYRSLAVLLLQSGFDCRTSLELRYGDIKTEYETSVIPLCLCTERFKTEIPFLSFIGTWGVRTLREYLNSRGSLAETDRLFPVSEQAVDAYFRRCAVKFLNKELSGERNPCSPHSLRAAFSTFCRDNLSGEARPAEVYIDFWMGKSVLEQKGVYISKTVESWRQTWRERAEPFVTPLSVQASWQ